VEFTGLLESPTLIAASLPADGSKSRQSITHERAAISRYASNAWQASMRFAKADSREEHGADSRRCYVRRWPVGDDKKWPG
jgi:hypothetical protein